MFFVIYMEGGEYHSNYIYHADNEEEAVKKAIETSLNCMKVKTCEKLEDYARNGVIKLHWVSTTKPNKKSSI